MFLHWLTKGHSAETKFKILLELPLLTRELSSKRSRRKGSGPLSRNASPSQRRHLPSPTPPELPLSTAELPPWPHITGMRALPNWETGRFHSKQQISTSYVIPIILFVSQLRLRRPSDLPLPHSRI